MRRYLPYAVGLAAAWVMLWDKVSVANIVGGLLVAAAILFVFPLQSVPAGERRTVRPLALVRLAGAVVRDLAVSNVTVALQILSRNQELHSGIVACRMRTASEKSLSTIANVLALSPGTMAVDAIAEPPTIFIHVLTVDDLADVRRRAARLEALVIAALGSDIDRRALAAHPEGDVIAAETGSDR